MRDRLCKTMLALAALVWASVPSEAQVDLSTVLVGTWEGEVQMAAGTYPRSLIIRSIPAAAQSRVVEAEWGGSGNERGGLAPRLAPVAVMVEAFGKDVILRFRTPEAWAVELTLYKDQRHLFGAMHIPVSLGGGWGINPVKLTKVE